LHPRTTRARDDRVLLCHGTERTGLVLACGMDHVLTTECRHSERRECTPDFGQIAFTIDAEPGKPVRLEKFIVYHTSATASPEQVCGRVEWTLDRIRRDGFEALLESQQCFMDDFWKRSDVKVQNLPAGTQRRTAAEVQ